MNRANRIDTAEERIGKLEDRSKETVLHSADGVKKKKSINEFKRHAE